MPRRTVIFLVSLLALLAFLTWTAYRLGDVELDPKRIYVEKHGLEAPPAAEDPEVSVESSSSTSREAADLAASDAGEDEPATDELACVLVGRLVDLDDAPVTDAEVRIQAYQVWSTDEDVPRLAGPYDLRGFAVHSDSSGRFRLETPLPTNPHTWLTIAPDPFHDSYRVSFGGTNRGALPALGLGTRELGDIRLAITGAVSGIVRDPSGRPVAGAKMGIGPGPSTTYSRDTSTGEDGRYLIAHAPIGTYGVKVKAEGFLSQFMGSVTVDGSHTTGNCDFVLVGAPSISGRVVDEFDRPVVDATISGWPASSGSSARSKSESDGRFVLYLPQAERYSVEASKDGHESAGTRSKHYEPGTTDLNVILRTLPKTRFRVVDDETGEPLLRYGLTILKDNGSESKNRVHTERRPPQLTDHPDGVVDKTARTGIDVYFVAADGYLAADGDVRHDEEHTPLQTVRMRRGGTVTGRVVRKGNPVSGAVVEVKRGFVQDVRDKNGLVTGQRFIARNHSARSGTTDSEGRFRIEAIEGGTHRITVAPPEGAPFVRMPLELKSHETNDVGDLRIQDGAAIAGTVLLPHAVAPGGLDVYLGHWQDGVSALTDKAGAFRFENLPAGTHTLTLGERPGVLASSEPVTVDLRPGETRAITLDALDRGTCEVTLAIDLGTIRAEGCQVDLVSADGERARLSKCDANGRATGSPRAWGEARVIVWLPGNQPVEHPTARLSLVRGDSINQSIRFELSSVTVVLPSDLTLPSGGYADLALEPISNELPSQRCRVSWNDDVSNTPTTPTSRYESGSFWFGGLTAGNYGATIRIVDTDAEYERLPIGDGTFRLSKPTLYEYRSEIRLEGSHEHRIVCGKTPP